MADLEGEITEMIFANPDWMFPIALNSEPSAMAAGPATAATAAMPMIAYFSVGDSRSNALTSDPMPPISWFIAPYWL